MKTIKTLRSKNVPKDLHVRAAPIVVLAMVVAVAASGISLGTFAAAATAKAPAKTSVPAKRVVKPSAPKPLTGILKELDDLRILIPAFDLSPSPIPNVKISTMNLPFPQLAGKGMFKNYAVDKDVSPQPIINVQMPDIDSMIQKFMPGDIPQSGQIPAGMGGPPSGIPSGIPANIPSGLPTGGAVPAPPSTPPSVPPSPGTPSSGGAPEINATNCAQFSSMPSAQYCSFVQDANGQAMCNQCKAAGL